MITRRASIRRWMLVAGALAAPAACAEAPVVETIPTETFVASYVDLRMAALRQGVDQIPIADRDRILAEHGVSEEDLLAFADAWGGQPQFMQPVWDSIEARIDRARIATGTSGAGPAPDTASPDSTSGS